MSNDLIAAVVVTIMRIQQSLAYALLAGLPPEAGIYASIAPIILYALFGTSRALAVGPVAVVSLLTAAAIGQVAEQGTAGYAVAALTLALLSGEFLSLMGTLRLGFLANFLSHPVIAGFATASGSLIPTSQIKHSLGVTVHGHTRPDMLASIHVHWRETQWITVLIGGPAAVFLFCVRGNQALVLRRLRAGSLLTDLVAKGGPVLAVVATTLAVWAYDLGAQGLDIVGGCCKACRL